MSIISELSIALARGLGAYFNFVDRLVGTTIRIRGDETGLKISLEGPQTESIDQRILKIDEARKNLEDGLKAIDELRITAEDNKRELNSALQQLEQVQLEKEATKSELDHLQTIASTDTDALRKIVGIPSKADKLKQQFVGFVAGVLASLLAAVIFWVGEFYLLRFFQ